MLGISQRLAQKYPNDVEVWTKCAEALDNLGRTEDAIMLLKGKVDHFDDPSVPYLLACFSAKLGRIEEARAWLKGPFDSELKDYYKALALENSDLVAVWKDFS